MILLRTSVGKKLLIMYLSSICLAWKSVSHMRFNSSSQDAFAPWALGLPQRCQICSLPEMRGSGAAEREAKELPQPGHGDQKEGGGKPRDGVEWKSVWSISEHLYKDFYLPTIFKYCVG